MSGFSLFEIIIALFLISFSLLALVNGLFVAQQYALESQRLMQNQWDSENHYEESAG